MSGRLEAFTDGEIRALLESIDVHDGELYVFDRTPCTASP
jgi:hypothetical protein